MIELFKSLTADPPRTAQQHELDNLRKLLEIKNEFLWLAVHELQRPLGIFKGYLSMIQDGTYGPVSDKLTDGLLRVDASREEMAMLVEGLTVAARMEDQAEALKLETCDIREMVKRAVAVVGLEIKARNMRLENFIPESELLATVDCERLKMAVVNLLSNAIKYAPNGSLIRVKVRSKEGEVVIAVSDEGPGLDWTEIARIFERWTRGPEISPSGLGLGLYLVRKIVELHGGQVTVESSPGEGSTFSIVIPITPKKG